MIFSAIRKAHVRAPWAAALMLGCACLPAQAGWFSSDKPAPKTETAPAQQAAAPQANQPAANQPATNLEDSIRQAQLLRLAGQYPEAIKHLSQLMMIAADDARVISEYGKTLASMGRASDAVNFLTRAEQLQPTDWTVYSAMGVAYDQLGNQKAAQDAYEHALVLKPEEPSVLNNYALSRMLAKDPDMARKLAARAEAAVGISDPKITRNIAMIRSLAPETPAPVAAATPAPAAHSQIATAPQAGKSAPPQTHDNRVVMQRVPVDPQAGPVPAPKPAAASTATQAPRSLQPQVADAVHVEPHIEAAKPFSAQPLPPPAAPVKAAEIKPAPAAPVKAAPAANLAKAAPPVKAAEVASASVTLRLAPPLKGESDKPAQPPKVLPPGPVKAASKEAVPGLRVSASAY
jgi:Flp pilus assembly protein TadD